MMGLSCLKIAVLSLCKSIKTELIPHRKHTVSITKASWIMLCGEIVYFESNMKPINTLCEESAEVKMLKNGIHVVTTMV